MRMAWGFAFAAGLGVRVELASPRRLISDAVAKEVIAFWTVAVRVRTWSSPMRTNTCSHSPASIDSRHCSRWPSVRR
jgi:hypothetical protein